MCWSARVSLISWIFDTACLGALVLRNRRDDWKYVAFLSGIGCQEFFQFLAWRLVPENGCSFPLALASLGAMFSSQAIPLGLLAGASTEKQTRRAVVAFALWALQFSVVVACVALSRTWCIVAGENGHQSWICAQSLYAVGGFALYFVAFACYAASIVVAFRVIDLPKSEKKALIAIGGLSAGIIYGFYSATLEACSIWCWSAAALSVYALKRPTESRGNGASLISA